jgi:hypothetical protein
MHPPDKSPIEKLLPEQDNVLPAYRQTLVGSSAKKIDLNFKELKMLNKDLLLTEMYS